MVDNAVGLEANVEKGDRGGLRCCYVKAVSHPRNVAVFMIEVKARTVWLYGKWGCLIAAYRH